MNTAKAVALLGFLAMTGILIYAFTAGNFAQEGRTLLSMPWGIVSLVDLYVGFVLFSGWIVYRERSLARSIVWIDLPSQAVLQFEWRRRDADIRIQVQQVRPQVRSAPFHEPGERWRLLYPVRQLRETGSVRLCLVLEGVGWRRDPGCRGQLLLRLQLQQLLQLPLGIASVVLTSPSPCSSVSSGRPTRVRLRWPL